MFGTNNAQPSNDDPAMLDSVKQLATTPAGATATAPPPAVVQPSATAVTPTHPALETTPTAPTAHPEPAAGFSSMPVAANPAATPTTAQVKPAPVSSPAPADLTATTPPSSTHTVASVSTPATTTSNDTPAEPDAEKVDHEELAGMKQHALDHLEPLVEHLDQTAEEEFKTTMMMIQSNDNHTLLEKALEAAKRITDDTARAEALLDIINEINYFASQKAQDS